MSYQVTLTWVNDKVESIKVEYPNGTSQVFR